MTRQFHTNRRNFIKLTMLSGAGVAVAPWVPIRSRAVEMSPAAKTISSRVALTTGNERAELVFKGLRGFEKSIATAIGQKQVIVKPNNVAIDNQLAASDAQQLEGILEFLKSIGKSNNIFIAESAANGPTLEGFSNYGYDRLAGKYGAKLMDLDQEECEIVHCFDEIGRAHV